MKLTKQQARLHAQAESLLAQDVADICFEHARLHPAPTSDDGSNQ